MNDEERFRARRAFVAQAKVADARHSPAVMKTALRPGLRVNHSAIDAAVTVLGDPLDRTPKAAMQRLGLRKDSTVEAKAAPPDTYRPLAGLQQSQRGQALRIDSTLFGAPASALPRNSPGFFPETIVVQTMSPGDDAEMITVTLGFGLTLDQPPADLEVAAFDTRVVCRVEWGIGGATFQAEIDWDNGTMFSVCANFLRIVAVVPDNGELAGLGYPLFLLDAALAYGSTPAHQNRVKRTIDLDPDFDVGDSVTIPIPRFAIGFNVLCYTPQALTLTQIGQIGSTVGGTICLYQHQYLGNGQNIPQGNNCFPIGFGARFLQVDTGNPEATLALTSVVFELAF